MLCCKHLAFFLQAQKQRLADALEKVDFNDRQQLFPRNKPNDRCYLLRSGAVQLTAAEGSVSRLTDGACIGERALVAGDNRCISYACVMANAVLVWPLSKGISSFFKGNALLYAKCPAVTHLQTCGLHPLRCTTNIYNVSRLVL